jgi:hypothetical protein
MNMHKHLFSILILITVIFAGCRKEEGNRFYLNNPEPLLPNAYIRLPLGSVKPEGWLKSQLELQASGLTGNLDDFWPDLVNSAWKGGDGEGWERAPYYLDGLIPLAWLLNDQKLIEKAKRWVNAIIASRSDSGWYGPAKNKDRWPLAVANKVLMQYYEATGDTSALNIITHYFRYLHDSPPDWPDDTWRGARAMENAVTGYWLYRIKKEPWILETIESIQKNSPDWTSYLEKFPWDSAASADRKIPLNWKADGLTAHVVNNAMAIKYPGLWYQQSGDERFKKAVFDGIRKFDIHHGQAGGRFSGDEHLSGKSPDRGTELCSVVEYMFSLEELYEIFGDNSLADRLELLAFNSLPGTITPDFRAHQYDQQSNQVLVSAAERGWSTNKEFSNIYGLMPNYGCCLANMHQGWPKFTETLWMATNDNGLVAVAYSPSKVTAKVGKGTVVTISEDTEYPFRSNISLKISTPESVKFPVYLRIPAWADSAVIKSGKRRLKGSPGSTVKLEQKWKDGDVITMDLPMKVKTEKRYNNAVAVTRGPLYYSLRIGKKYRSIKPDHDNYNYKGVVDWEIQPATDWNYALMLDPVNASRGMRIIENPIGKYPFADRGDMVWSEDSSFYRVWQKDPPVMIQTRGIPVPEWGMENNSAAIPPKSPVNPQGDLKLIELVPYGCTRLRITEFPFVDVVFMEDIMRPSR